VAFGTAHPEISQNEVQNNFTNTRTKVDWRVEGALQRADSKLVFLVVQCLENTLPWGGHMTLSRFEGNWKRVARGSKPTLTCAVPQQTLQSRIASPPLMCISHFCKVQLNPHDVRSRPFFNDRKVTVTF
jgi:hypothetical protein